MIEFRLLGSRVERLEPSLTRRATHAGRIVAEDGEAAEHHVASKVHEVTQQMVSRRSQMKKRLIFCQSET